MEIEESPTGLNGWNGGGIDLSVLTDCHHGVGVLDKSMPMPDNASNRACSLNPICRNRPMIRAEKFWLTHPFGACRIIATTWAGIRSYSHPFVNQRAHMTHELYRFRPITRLLGENGELDNQEIYFAHPSQLNDPMEGYRDIVWCGDEIIWKNLFRHYIYCLQHAVTVFLIAGDDHELSENDIPVFGSTNDLPSKELKELIYNISHRFLENKNIAKLIANIIKRNSPIRKDELEFYLSTAHMCALKIVFDVFIEKGISPESNKLPSMVEEALNKVSDDAYFKAIDDVLNKDANGDKHLSILFLIQKQIKQQINLLAKYNATEIKNNKNFLLSDFPALYIKSLEKICFPEWYTACFMSECTSSSVWGHYGSNHSGACLIFNAEEINGRKFIKLKGINGWSSSHGETRGWFNLEFQKIIYEKGQATTDFFRSLGSLTRPTINSMWYQSSEGEHSSCADHMSSSEDEWRSAYWESFYKDIKIKTKDWSYENEYRLILLSSVTDLSDSSKRILNYEFSSLIGIIFGINTKDEDKIEIIKIIEKKCKKSQRENFKFYQAYFCFESNCIKRAELNLFNLKDPQPTRQD